ncbi:Protein yippee-like [Capsicum chinense]|nr:Protein yippee-like [Capsicum chinense]
MGRIFVVDLEGRSYNCKFCKTQFALADDIVSKLALLIPQTSEDYQSNRSTKNSTAKVVQIPVQFIESDPDQSVSRKPKSDRSGFALSNHRSHHVARQS